MSLVIGLIWSVKPCLYGVGSYHMLKTCGSVCPLLECVAKTCDDFDQAQIRAQVGRKFFTHWPPSASWRKLVSVSGVFTRIRVRARLR